MRYNVRHTTTYHYSDPVALCQNQVHLSPRNCATQVCEAFSLEVLPEPVVRRPWTDYFGNDVWYFSLEGPHRELSITARSIVRKRATSLPNPDQTPAWEVIREQLASAQSSWSTRQAAQFIGESTHVTHVAEVLDYGRASFTPGRPLLEAALDLTARIFHDFKYVPGATTWNTPTAEVFKEKSGVCQDFAHLQITCLRMLGLAARYVSGYLLTDPPPGQEKLIGADASHAWLSVFCPDLGWVDLDPTNNCIPEFRHITTAWGRDYHDVCPIKGVFVGGGEHSMTVAVDVSPIKEEPATAQ